MSSVCSVYTALHSQSQPTLLHMWQLKSVYLAALNLQSYGPLLERRQRKVRIVHCKRLRFRDTHETNLLLISKSAFVARSRKRDKNAWTTPPRYSKPSTPPRTRAKMHGTTSWHSNLTCAKLLRRDWFGYTTIISFSGSAPTAPRRPDQVCGRGARLSVPRAQGEQGSQLRR
jgi:hypothetical protein